jgi:hypothetical protein
MMIEKITRACLCLSHGSIFRENQANLALQKLAHKMLDKKLAHKMLDKISNTSHSNNEVSLQQVALPQPCLG